MMAIFRHILYNSSDFNQRGVWHMQKDDKKPSTKKIETRTTAKKTVTKNTVNKQLKSDKTITKKTSVPKRTKSNHKYEWYKDIRVYFLGMLYLMIILFLVQLAMVKVLPTKYILVIIILLGLFGWGLWWLQYGKKVNRINQTLGKMLIVVFCILLLVGNIYLNKTTNILGKISDVNYETDTVAVIVLKDSDYQELSDLRDRAFGAYESADPENTAATLDDIKNTLDDSFNYKTYNSYDEEAKALYEGEIDALILNEAYRGLMENTYPRFDEDTRVIYNHEIKREVKDFSKDVDVTNTPFNVYITGIDTYGSVATRSRSDVNMIATVNPNTHQILLTSIPRDFYVSQTCQAGAQDKLTHTGIFGVECTVNTAEQFFGIEINYYARVNFTSLISMVDALGGITVDNPNYFTAQGYTFDVGSIYLNGDQALAFARERYSFADGDRERGRNQMRVITGMINKAISPAIIYNYTGIMDAIGGSFQTNMGSSDITSFINKQIDTMNGWDIQQQSGTGYGDTLYSPATGFYSYMMVPDMDSVNAAVTRIQEVLQAE